MIVPISEIVSIPQIVCVAQIVSISEIVCVPWIVSLSQIVSIPELRSSVSLIQHACDSWISAIREWGDTLALRDRCDRVWTGTRE